MITQDGSLLLTLILMGVLSLSHQLNICEQLRDSIKTRSFAIFTLRGYVFQYNKETCLFFMLVLVTF